MKKTGLLLIFMLGLLPIIPLLLNSPPLDNYDNITFAIGQTAGLMGMTLFAISFILSSRLRFVERIFGGLDKVYKVHSLIGATAFVLILIHPIFLLLKYIPDSIRLAAIYLIPGNLFSVNFGIFALAGMIVLLVFTLYMKMKYNRWKFSHKFMSLFFILASLHIFLVRGTVSRDNIFPGYYVYATIVVAIGLIGILYGMLLRPKAAYVVESVDQSNNCFDLTLKPVRKPIKYNAGQFAFLTIPSITNESHPYSIASPSNSPNLRFVIKMLGDYTSRLDKVKVGDRVFVEGPYGNFNRKSNAEQVWIAGGIGITPFLGMMQETTAQVKLYYTVKTDKELIALNPNKNVRVFEWNSNERGRLTLENIQFGKNTEFYLCGPVEMKNAFRNGLISAGVPARKIFDEEFNFK